MAGERVEVSAYAGYRGEERPRAFVLRGERIEVLEVLRSWVGEGPSERERKRFFRLKGSDGRLHTLYYDEGRGAWFTG